VWVEERCVVTKNRLNNSSSHALVVEYSLCRLVTVVYSDFCLLLCVLDTWRLYAPCTMIKDIIEVVCNCKTESSSCYCESIGKLTLTAIREGDEPAFVDCLTRTPLVQDQTLRIPHPFHLSDAKWWVQHNITNMAEKGKIFNFAIRQNSTCLVIGNIGINDIIDGVAELGYWVSSQYWGMGIMPTCIMALTRFAVTNRETYGIETLQACIFDGNARSGRALEKCGFNFVEYLPDYYEKNGEKFSAMRYQYDISSFHE
jgi:RimJ/RimL family protein N-acetyltransferase